MKVYHSLEDYEPGIRTVATIGTFDGVHHGHKVILNRIIEAAKAINGESVLISFHPHPRLVLFPENNPLRLLHSLEEKIKCLEELGLDKLLLIPFTREFSRTPSKAFIKDILVEKVGIDKIIIGYDHHFGKNRTGGIEELRELAEEGEYAVEEIPAQSIDDAQVSSTKIRKAIKMGDMNTANKYLEYNYGLSGKVIHGKKLGRTLGYPTANMKLNDPLKLAPADGVYWVNVFVGERKHYGMMSIGTKPTLGENERAYEAYIFDFSEEIYGQTIRVEFLEFLRGQEKFDSLQVLVEAMKRDEAYCRKQMAELN